MRAYRLHQFNGPSSLRLENLPAPEPGHGQVRVAVKAASLNFRDLMISKGAYNPNLPLPLIPLSDGAGEVVAVGPGVADFRPGDRVIANFMAGWIEGPIDERKARTALGGEVSGMLAEQVVLPAACLVKFPDHLSFEEAATLPCAALTAWHALFVGARIKPGDTVLTLGTGGVSVFAVQFAKQAGARVLATSSSDEKLAKLKELGADELINYKKTPEWAKEVRSLTGGRGVDAIVEVGGAGTLPQSIRAIRMGGYIGLIGLLAGRQEFDPIPLLMNSIRLNGIFVGSRAMLAEMCEAIDVNRLRPVIDQVFPFDQAVDALAHLESGSHFGKVVIRM